MSLPKVGFALLLLVVVAGVVVTPAAAQPPEDRVSPDRVNEIARNLYCPLCPGLTVDVCELQVCDDMKDVIAQQLAEGKSEEQIRQHFLELYGPKVIGAPEKHGTGLLAWLLPGVFAVAAVGAGIWWLRRRDTESAPDTDTTPIETVDGDYNDRIDRELQRFELE